MKLDYDQQFGRLALPPVSFLVRTFQIQISRDVKPPGFPRLVIHLDNFLRCSVTAIIGGSRNFTALDLVPLPLADHRWPRARAIKSELLRRSDNLGHEVRPVPVRTAGDQITSQASRTFHTVTNTSRHKIGTASVKLRFQASPERRFGLPHPNSAAGYPPVFFQKMVSNNSHELDLDLNHYDPPSRKRVARKFHILTSHETAAGETASFRSAASAAVRPLYTLSFPRTHTSRAFDPLTLTS